MNWIRVAVAIGDDPKVYALCEALGCRVAEAVGLLVLVLAKLPEHAPDGNLAAVPATLVERWAGWEGERGAFDRAFRATFLKDGLWSAWEKHNGAALRKATADRDRMRQSRDGRADRPSTVAPTVPTPVEGTNERTYGRSTTTGRSRAKNGNGNDPPPKPALLEGIPFARPFCAVCGGEPNENERGRIVGLRHKEGCANG